jgi:hypothetical protein
MNKSLVDRVAVSWLRSITRLNTTDIHYLPRENAHQWRKSLLQEWSNEERATDGQNIVCKHLGQRGLYLKKIVLDTSYNVNVPEIGQY